jgi:hypothetical protein
MSKQGLPMTILTAAIVAACIGCAAPVRPELKSARSHQVNVDFENVALLARFGWDPFYPFSTPHCPYYDRRSKLWLGAGLTCPSGYETLPASQAPTDSELPPPEGQVGPSGVGPAD